MKNIEYAMRFVCKRNRDGSYGTMANRENSLRLMGRQLNDMGFKHLKRTDQLKPKHVWTLVNRWKEEGISEGAMKNRMAHLRWLADKTGNRGLVARDNDHYGIERRRFVTNESRAVEFTSRQLEAIQDPYIRVSAELQRDFGLRREEALKFIPTLADQGDKIRLQASWCKGGKEREIPIRNEQQRATLDRAHKVAKGLSLIPQSRRYVEHMNCYAKAMHKIGLGKTHGARHLYAQQRYHELSGRLPPALGGQSRKDMSSEEREKDDQIRLRISRELGHERIQIVAVYIGS